MLVIDELKKNDPQLRLVALLLAAGLLILLAGLWWVQVVSAREYEEHLVTQAYRTIRVPAVRGKILDCEGRVLAENRPRYNLSLYLGELRKQFKDADDQVMRQAHAWQLQAIAVQEKKLGHSLSKAERKQFAFTADQLERYHQQARDQVATEEIAKISHNSGETIPFDIDKFNRHYATALAMPFPILENLSPEQIARFQENFTNGFGADLELQSMRYYPNGTTAAHVLGELRMDDSSIEGEDSFFNYRLPDYRGETGIEGKFNAQLHGRAGQVSVMVNNMGYRQEEDVETQPQAGDNVVLTLDLDLQEAAEKSLAEHQPTANAAVVVMNVRNGDVLAMASTPTFDPNDFAQAHGIPREKYDELLKLSAEKNRATQENYAPGSTFKVVVGLAALDAGLNPAKEYTVEPDPANPSKGMFFGKGYRKKDTAEPGQYNFKHALEKSSNSYFIQIGLQAGVDRIVELAHRFHLGEGNRLPTLQETRGNMPTLERVHHDWREGDTANICIGQGEVAVTPLQMAVVYSAIANGGTVYWPRLVSKIEPQDPSSTETTTNFPAGVVRDHIGVGRRSLKILFDAMLGETEEGTGTKSVVEGLDICGKTGTAQVQDSSGTLIGYNFWFASFAPYQSPKYAVIVMVSVPPEHGSGGVICAPIAHDIYQKIVDMETGRTKPLAMVK
jgi:penicillin-binding protein 2